MILFQSFSPTELSTQFNEETFKTRISEDGTAPEIQSAFG